MPPRLGIPGFRNCAVRLPALEYLSRKSGGHNCFALFVREEDDRQCWSLHPLGETLTLPHPGIKARCFIAPEPGSLGYNAALKHGVLAILQNPRAFVVGIPRWVTSSCFPEIVLSDDQLAVALTPSVIIPLTYAH